MGHTSAELIHGIMNSTDITDRTFQSMQSLLKTKEKVSCHILHSYLSYCPGLGGDFIASKEFKEPIVIVGV